MKTLPKLNKIVLLALLLLLAISEFASAQKNSSNLFFTTLANTEEEARNGAYLNAALGLISAIAPNNPTLKDVIKATEIIKNNPQIFNLNQPNIKVTPNTQLEISDGQASVKPKFKAEFNIDTTKQKITKNTIKIDNSLQNLKCSKLLTDYDFVIYYDTKSKNYEDYKDYYKNISKVLTEALTINDDQNGISINVKKVDDEDLGLTRTDENLLFKEWQGVSDIKMANVKAIKSQKRIIKISDLKIAFNPIENLNCFNEGTKVSLSFDVEIFDGFTGRIILTRRFGGIDPLLTTIKAKINGDNPEEDFKNFRNNQQLNTAVEAAINYYIRREVKYKLLQSLADKLLKQTQKDKTIEVDFYLDTRLNKDKVDSLLTGFVNFFSSQPLDKQIDIDINNSKGGSENIQRYVISYPPASCIKYLWIKTNIGNLVGKKVPGLTETLKEVISFGSDRIVYSNRPNPMYLQNQIILEQVNSTSAK